MATKAAPKKSVAKKDTSKKPAKVTVPATTPKPKQGEKKAVAVKKPKATLISYSMKATIPTMMYGNIMPEIVVTAPTLEDAHAFVFPYLEELYNAYAEEPRDGKSKPKFMTKASVTSQERIVTPTSPIPAAPVTPTQPAAAAPMPPVQSNSIVPPQAEAPKQTTVEEQVADVEPLKEKSLSYQKAENAIANSFTIEAIDLVQSQVTKSGKLDSNEKNHLYTSILKKKAELNNKK